MIAQNWLLWNFDKKKLFSILSPFSPKFVIPNFDIRQRWSRFFYILISDDFTIWYTKKTRRYVYMSSFSDDTLFFHNDYVLQSLKLSDKHSIIFRNLKTLEFIVYSINFLLVVTSSSKLGKFFPYCLLLSVKKLLFLIFSGFFSPYFANDHLIIAKHSTCIYFDPCSLFESS